MDIDDRHRAFEQARLRGELTVQELWLRYLALGGEGDEFEIDGFLQGLVPLDTFRQTVLAQALNERLQELYDAARIPLPTPTPERPRGDSLRGLVEHLLHERAPEPERGPGPESGDRPADNRT